MPKTDWVLTELHNSRRAGKKHVAIFINGKTGQSKSVHFGQQGSKTYLDHGDKQIREAYRARHSVYLNPEDLTSPAYLSYFLLWGESTSLAQNLRFYVENVLEQEFKLRKIDRSRLT